MEQYVIPGKTGFAFKVNKGQRIRVIDMEGQQIADFVAYHADHLEERLDSVATRDALGSMDIRVGDSLYSNLYRPMLTLLKDTVGKHDLLSPACRPEMYRLLYNKELPVDNCFDNLSQALAGFGIPAPSQHCPFNIFMNTVITPDHQIQIKSALSGPGDYVEMRAETDLVIAISACPNEESAGNGYRSTPIKVEVYD